MWSCRGVWSWWACEHGRVCGYVGACGHDGRVSMEGCVGM